MRILQGLAICLQLLRFHINNSNRRYYSTLTTLQPDNINPWFYTGFFDGESSFMINVVKSSKYRTGWFVQLSFSIGLHKKDRAVLELIQNYLGVGQISEQGSEAVRFRINSIKDFPCLMDHLDKYPLITQKWADYQLFKIAFSIIESKEHLTTEGLKKLVNIKASMNKGYLSDELKAAFHDYIPVQKPLLQIQEIKDPNWISGFISGEGSFYIIFTKSLNSRLGEKVRLRFSISQHIRDEALIRSLILYLGCGAFYTKAGGSAVEFTITKFEDMTNKLIPFLKKYPIQGVKALDLADWCKVAELIKNKSHLTSEGLKDIREIHKGMNLRRK